MALARIAPSLGESLGGELPHESGLVFENHAVHRKLSDHREPLDKWAQRLLRAVGDCESQVRSEPCQGTHATSVMLQVISAEAEEELAVAAETDSTPLQTATEPISREEGNRSPCEHVPTASFSSVVATENRCPGAKCSCPIQ